MKALLSFRITTDHEDFDTPVYVHVKLYSEDGQLIWRLSGEFGDECETLPRPKSVKQAKEDVRLVYPKGGEWKPSATWL